MQLIVLLLVIVHYFLYSLNIITSCLLQSLEEYKQQFEDRLGSEAGEVGRGLERLRQLVQELEDMSEASLVAKYMRVSEVSFVAKYMRVSETSLVAKYI